MENLDLMHIWGTMSFLAKLVSITLILMAIGSLFR